MFLNLELNAALWMDGWMDGIIISIQDFFSRPHFVMRNTLTKYAESYAPLIIIIKSTSSKKKYISI